MRKPTAKHYIIPILMLCVLFAPAICTVVAGHPNVYAGNSIADYWTDDNALTPSGRVNIFFNIDNPYVKISIFVVSVIFSYLLFFGLFKLSVQQSSGPPDKAFFWCFFSFLFMVYGLVFVCFHEYLFLTQVYDPTETIISQVRWLWIVASLVVWGIVSLIATNWLRQ
jgi:hypothetical protein